MVDREDCNARPALREWLKERAKTQAWLARMAGVSAPSVNSWLDGTSRPVQHLREIIEHLTGGVVRAADWETASEREAREKALERIAAEPAPTPAEAS